jgi:HK97 family phage portal protein
MSLLTRIFGRSEKRSKPTSWDHLRNDGYLTESGSPVSAHLAENLSAVFACVQIISQTVAMLPLVFYRKAADGARFEDREHPVARLFAGDINAHQTTPEFIELMQAHCLLRGNSYAEIVRDGRGAPVALIPHHPDAVAVERIPRMDRIRFVVTDPNGGSRRLLQEEMLHLRDRSDDGMVGKSRLQRAREAFGIAIASERYAANVFRNGASMSGFVSHPETLGSEATKTLRESLQALYSGASNAGNIGVLEEGMTWHQLSVSPLDAQALESRRFSVESIARLFGVPPQLLGDTSKAAHSNVVEASRFFARFCVQPWLTKWEHALARSLLSSADRETREFEVDMDDFLRGDMLQRFQAYRIAREIGAYNANEIRRFEKQNPRTDPGGDEYFSPLNMSPPQEGAPKDKD